MGNPWQKSVEVTLQSVNPLQYSIAPTGTNPLPTQNGVLVFNNDHHNGFDIQFTFIDQTNSGYLWPPNNLKGQSVWSTVGTGNPCPGSPNTEVFHAIGVDQSRTVLTVNNPNPSPAQGAFQYTLCVTNDGGNTYLQLDPGGLNNNGPTSVSYANSIQVVAVAAVALIAIVALYEFGAFG
jgi:hypothetical protein